MKALNKVLGIVILLSAIAFSIIPVYSYQNITIAASSIMILTYIIKIINILCGKKSSNIDLITAIMILVTSIILLIFALINTNLVYNMYALIIWFLIITITRLLEDIKLMKTKKEIGLKKTLGIATITIICVLLYVLYPAIFYYIVRIFGIYIVAIDGINLIVGED